MAGAQCKDGFFGSLRERVLISDRQFGFKQYRSERIEIVFEGRYNFFAEGAQFPEISHNIIFVYLSLVALLASTFSTYFVEWFCPESSTAHTLRNAYAPP